MRRTMTPLLMLAVTAVTGCKINESDSSAASAPPTEVTTQADATPARSLRCDPLDERSCLLPWPNDAFTVPDDASSTGKRLDIHPESTPIDVAGVPIDVTSINGTDGFSPASVILTVVPGLDLGASKISGADAVARSLADDSPIVLLDTTAGTRLSYWAQVDQSGVAGDELLTIHPADDLIKGHRIVVALRNLKSADGSTIVATTAFEAAVEGTPEPSERAPAFDSIFAALADNGVATDDLFLAWDFTVASTLSTTGDIPIDVDARYSDSVDRALARAFNANVPVSAEG